MTNTIDILGCLERAAHAGQPVMAHQLEGFRQRKDLDPSRLVARQRLITSHLGPEVFRRVSFQYLTTTGEQEVSAEHRPLVLGEISVKLEVQRPWHREEGNQGESQWAQVCLRVTKEDIDIAHEITPIEKEMTDTFKECFKKWGFFMRRHGRDGYQAEMFELREMHNLPLVVL